MQKYTDLKEIQQFANRFARHTVGVPIAIGIVMCAIVVCAWLFIPTKGSQAPIREARTDLANFAARLESHVSTRLSIGERIGKSVADGDLNDRVAFTAKADYLHYLFSDFQAINWTDSMGVIRWVTPLEGNEAVINQNVRERPIAGETINRAEETKRVQVTPPLKLIQGGEGFVAYIPVVKLDRVLGFVNIVFRIDPLVRGAMPFGLLKKYDVIIDDGDRRVFDTLAPDQEWNHDDLVHRWVVIGNRVWTVGLLPTPEMIASHRSFVDEAVLVTLLLLTIIIAYLIHLAMVRQLRIKATDKMFRTFIEHSPSAIIIKDIDGNYLHTNSKWNEWFNPEGKEFIGQNSFDFFPTPYAQHIIEQHKEIIHEKKMIEREYESSTADGVDRQTFVQMFPIMDQDGRILAVGGSITDISANKKNEEMLRHALMKAEEANLAKSKFLATMSHELRTPLNAIIGFSDILVGQYFGSLGHQKYGEYAKDINQSGRHLLALINEVLDISAIELGKRDMQIEPLSVHSLLSDCVKSIKHRAAARGIRVALLTDAALPRIHADETAMRQIILNLLTNAIKFSHEGDQITVAAKATDNDISIEVADTGEGIKEEQLPTITQPFVKGHSSSHITHEGVGLGLSIVSSFVAAHKGQLHIDSELGKGTTVTITFPRKQNRQVA